MGENRIIHALPTHFSFPFVATLGGRADYRHGEGTRLRPNPSAFPPLRMSFTFMVGGLRNHG